MNINAESHFSQLPHAQIQRSIMDRSSSHKTSFNVGDLIPIFWDEVLPGDTFKVSTSKVVRLQTLLTPIMDNLYLDTYWFFVPNRLLWTHWQQFMGENTESAWVPETVYTVPKIKSPSGGFTSGTIADYLGIPVGVEFGADGDSLPISLPFRAYALIADQWFRDQNLTDPLLINLGDSVQQGSNGSSYVEDVANGGQPFKVAKYHDYFTSCLPSPQKGTAVDVPLPAPYEGGLMPVFSSEDWIDGTKYYNISGANPKYNRVFKVYRSPSPFGDAPSSKRHAVFDYAQDGVNHTEWQLNNDGTLRGPDQTNGAIFPANLWADVKAGDPTGSLSINDLRLAFAAQQFLEIDARGGTRYVEVLKSHFGVTSPDARLQRSEYLGGNRVPIQVHQVTNTAQSETDFLGQLGAMSYTTDSHADIDHSFTEHGILMCVCCARYDHTYSQGLDKIWTRTNKMDYFFPVFSQLGEQPVLKNELFYDPDNDDVFGYQEAWAEYRYKPNRVSSEMRPDVDNTLASWHLADDYTEAPTLSDSWIREDKTNVDRTLAVTSLVSNQILLDCYFKTINARPMPMYSIPGLSRM